MTTFTCKGESVFKDSKLCKAREIVLLLRQAYPPKELRACPFCGGPPHETEEAPGQYTVACLRCGVVGPIRHLREAANKAWDGNNV